MPQPETMSDEFQSWLSTRPPPLPPLMITPRGSDRSPDNNRPLMTALECIRFGAKPKTVSTTEGIQAVQSECYRNMNERQNRLNHGLNQGEWGTTGEKFADDILFRTLPVFFFLKSADMIFFCHNNSIQETSFNWQRRTAVLAFHLTALKRTSGLLSKALEWMLGLAL